MLNQLLFPGVKKSTQELYALINYGEFRRKVGGTLNEKKGVKLHQLIQKGSSSIRVKGKCIRVRTPICRALKRINEYQGRFFKCLLLPCEN